MTKVSTTTYQYFDKSFLEELISHTNLSDLVAKTIELKKEGNYYKGLCPFHKETEPSFCVSIEHNRYYCYGCHSKGNVINWLMFKEKISFSEAVTLLSQQAGIPLPEYKNDDDTIPREELDAYHSLINSASSLYRYRLRKQHEAIEYLITQRKLSYETLDRFELGVVTSGIVQLLKNNASSSQLLGTGIAIRSRINDIELIDLLRYRICIPIHNEQGIIVGFAGRTYGNRENSIKYLNTPETALFIRKKEVYALYFAKEYIKKSNTAVIVEGFFDAMSLHQHGENRSVALMGTSISPEQLKKMFSYADNLIFVFDGDQLGKDGALNAALMTLSEIKENQTVKFFFLPENQDPDSYIHENGLDFWLQEIENAQSLSALLVEFITSHLSTSPESKAEALEKARHVLMKINHAEYFQRAFTFHIEKILGCSIKF